MKERDLSLDVIRIFACILVVFMHSPIPSENANGVFLAGLSYFTAPCIGLFFMVSGALLLPIRTDYFTFLIRRLSKVVIPTLVWTAVYLSLNIYHRESEINILQSIASVPFSAQGHGVLWFMYTMIGLYLLAPILSSWAISATDKELRFVLLLWLVTLCYPILNYGVYINPSTTGILYYFTGYAGYFLLGYTLKSGRISMPLIWPVLIAAAGVVLLLVFKYFGIEYDFYSLFWYESIFIVGLCCVYWIIVSKTVKCVASSINANKIVTTISNLSFGVYLSHILISRYLLWGMPVIYMIDNYILQTIIIASVTLVLSILLCLLLTTFSLGKWTIGYSS